MNYLWYVTKHKLINVPMRQINNLFFPFWLLRLREVNWHFQRCTVDECLIRKQKPALKLLFRQWMQFSSFQIKGCRVTTLLAFSVDIVWITTCKYGPIRKCTPLVAWWWKMRINHVFSEKGTLGIRSEPVIFRLIWNYWWEVKRTDKSSIQREQDQLVSWPRWRIIFHPHLCHKLLIY